MSAMAEQKSLPSKGYDREIERGAARVLDRMEDGETDISNIEYHISEVARELDFFGEGRGIAAYSQVIEEGHSILVPTSGLLNDCTGGEECLRRLAREQVQADLRVSVLESERGSDAIVTSGDHE